MTEVLGMMALAALTSLLLAVGWGLLVPALVIPVPAFWPRRARLLAVSMLCLSLANGILGYSLVPRYTHGSALHPQAGLQQDGTYLVVDQYGERREASAGEFWCRRVYEEGSRWLVGFLCPSALLLLIAGRWAERRSQSATS